MMSGSVRLRMRHGERIKALLTHAASLGVEAHVAYLPRDRRGIYDHARRRIVYAIDLTPIEQVSVFAHEIGHAYHEHVCDGDLNAERQADVYAARLLIDPEDYALLERITSDVELIADELGVIPELVDAWQQHCVTRLRGVTYTRARMGLGQWRHRSVHA